MERKKILALFLLMLVFSVIPPIVTTFSRNPAPKPSVSNDDSGRFTLTESDRELEISSSQSTISEDKQTQSSKDKSRKKTAASSNQKASVSDNDRSLVSSNQKAAVSSDQKASANDGNSSPTSHNASSKKVSTGGNQAKKGKTSKAQKSKKAKTSGQAVKTAAEHFTSDLEDVPALIANAIYTPTNLPRVAMVNALREGSDFTDDGDEQSFVCVLDDQGRRTKKLEVGREYQIHIFVHAVASAEARRQYAEDVSVLLREFPSGIMHAGSRQSVETHILWGGLLDSYRKCRYELSAKEDLVVELDPIEYPGAASAKYITAGKANGEQLPIDALVGYTEETGCKVGYDELDGTLPCGDKYAGEVEISFRTSRPGGKTTSSTLKVNTPTKSKTDKDVSNEVEVVSYEGVPNENTSDEVTVTNADTSEKDGDLAGAPAENSEQSAQIAVSAAPIATVDSQKNQSDFLKGLAVGLAIACVLGVLLMLALGFLIRMLYQNHLEQRVSSEAPSASDSAYAETRLYQQKVANAADMVVAGALFHAEYDMKFCSEKANLVQEIHKLIYQAITRVVRQEERQREYMLLMDALAELQHDLQTVPDAPYTKLQDQTDSTPLATKNDSDPLS